MIHLICSLYWCQHHVEVDCTSSLCPSISSLEDRSQCTAKAGRELVVPQPGLPRAGITMRGCVCFHTSVEKLQLFSLPSDLNEILFSLPLLQFFKTYFSTALCARTLYSSLATVPSTLSFVVLVGCILCLLRDISLGQILPIC